MNYIITTKVDNMAELFKNSNISNEVDVTRWDTENVKNMNEMFQNAKYFNQNISFWNIENVETMNYFYIKHTLLIKICLDGNHCIFTSLDQFVL